MKLNKFTWALLPVLLVACGGDEKKETPAADEGIELVNKATKGETYSITTTWDEKISSTDPTGKTQVNEIKMENEINYQVEEVSDKGVMTTKSKYAWLKMGAFDSKDSSTYEGEMGAMFKGMLEKEMVMKVDNRGHVLEVTGADGMFSMGAPNFPMDDNEIMKQNVENALNVFPGKKVKRGDSWENTHAIHFGYPCIYHNTYTLREVKDGIATIELKSEMEPNTEAPPTFFPGGVELKQDLNGTQSGTIHVDIEKGKILDTDCTLKINGKAKGKMGDQPLEIVMSTEVHITTKVNFK